MRLVQLDKSFCHFWCAKIPGFNGRKDRCICLILRALRALSRGSFRVSRNSETFVKYVLVRDNI